MSDLAKRSKVNLDLWNLFIAIICLIRLNISSENNNFGFNCIQKINFSKKIPFKCIRKQIDLDFK